MATAVINIDVKSQSLDQLEAKLQALQARIKAVPTGSAEFKKLTSEFQVIQKEVDKTNARIKGLKVDELAGNIAKITGGIGAGFAAVSLLYSDNEDATKALAEAQKTLVTVLASVQVAEGLASAANILRTLSLGAEAVATAKTTQTEILFTQSINENTIALAANARTRGLAAEQLAQELGIQSQNVKATKTGAIVTEEAAEANKGLGNSIKALGKNILTFLTSPIGIAIAAIGALVAATLALQAQFEKSARIAQYGQEVEKLDESIKTVTSNFDKALTAIISYNALVATGTLSAEEYALAQKQVSKELLSAGVSQEELNGILADGIITTEEYVDVLLKQIQVQVAIDQIRNSLKELVEFQADASEAAPTFFQTLGNSVLSFGNTTAFIFSQLETQAENSAEKTEELTNKIKKSVEIAKKLAEDPELKGLFENALFGPGGKAGLDKDAKSADEFLLSAQRKLRDSRIKLTKEGFDEEEALARENNRIQIEDARKKNADIQKDEQFNADEKAKANRALNAEIQAANNTLTNSLKEINKKRLAQSLDDAKKLLDQYISGQEEALNVYTSALETVSEETIVKIEKQNEDARTRRLKGDKTAVVKNEKEITIEILKEEIRRIEEITGLALVNFKTREEKLAQEKKRLEGKTDAESVKRFQELQKQEEDLADEKQEYVTKSNLQIAQKELQIVKTTNDQIEEDTKETDDAILKKKEKDLERLQKIYETVQAGIDSVNNFFQERANRQITSIQIQLEKALEEIDQQIEDLDKTEKKRIDDLNKSEVLGERAKANAIKQIEEKAERDRQELEKKKEEAQKSAKKKELEIQIKALDVAVAAQIAQATVSAASGIATATAQAPLTFGASLLLIAPIAAALAGAIAVYTQQRASLKEQLNSLNFAEGGYVSGPGTGTSDSVRANLSNGEFVVNAQSTSRNLPLLQAINSTSGNSGVDMTTLLAELKDEIASLRSKPIKTYVVTSDLAAAQQTEEYIARRAQI